MAELYVEGIIADKRDLNPDLWIKSSTNDHGHSFSIILT